MNCSLYGSHYWILDNKSYARCKTCGAEKDMQIKEKKSKMWGFDRSDSKGEYYNQGSLAIRTGSVDLNIRLTK